MSEARWRQQQHLPAHNYFHLYPGTHYLYFDNIDHDAKAHYKHNKYDDRQTDNVDEHEHHYSPYHKHDNYDDCRVCG